MVPSTEQSEKPRPPSREELARAYIQRRLSEIATRDDPYGFEEDERDDLLYNLEHLDQVDWETFNDYVASEVECRFWEDEPARNPEERRESWERIRQVLDTASKNLYGSPIEPGIRDAVVGLNLLLGGYYTVMSCEGHDGSSPWISFSLPGAKVPSEHYPRDPEKLHQLKGLLDEFYQSREPTDQQVTLDIFDDMEGQVSGSHRITTRFARARRDMTLAERHQADEPCEEERIEMARFTEFLKNKYFS